MRLQKNRNYKKRSRTLTIIVVVLLITLTLAVITIANLNGWISFPKNQQSEKIDTEKKDKDSGKKTEDQKVSTPSEYTTRESEKNLPTQYEGENDSRNDSKISGIINYKTVVDNQLILRTTINEVLGSGTCTLTLTRDSDQKDVQKTAEIVSNPSSSSCKGFNIPLTELGNGNWLISISITSDDKNGMLSDKITI